MPVTEGLQITELDSLAEQDGTELFVLVIDPSGTPINRKVVGDYLPLRGQPMFTVPGTLSVNTDAAPWFICSVPGGLQLLNTALAAKTAPTGAIIIVDIEVSNDGAVTWESIYSTRPTLSTKYNGETGTLSVTHIDQGDLLRVAIDQVGSTVAGADLTVSLWTRQGGTGTEAATTSTSTTTLTSTTTSTITTTTLAWQSPPSVYSSCGAHSAGPASYFVDGNKGSAWIHLVNEAHEIVVDLGSTKYVTKIRLYIYPDQKQSLWGFFQAYISNDPNNWGAPVLPWGIFRDGTYAKWVEQTLTVPKTGRYLKLTAIDTDDVLNHIMGAEFEVYAS